jgi:hypothetical protein
MTEHDTHLRHWLTIIQGEYREMPGLQLTKPQVRRMWGLDAPTCEAVLEALRGSRVLRLSPAGRYVVADRAVAGEF